MSADSKTDALTPIDTAASPQKADGNIALSINDLNIIAIILKKSFTAGLIEADDASAVGGTYTKIKNIIIEVSKRSQEAK